MGTIEMQALEGYASVSSVYPGETIAFQVRTQAPNSHFEIEISRKGKEDTLVHSGSGTASDYNTPDNASEVGCGWPPGYSLIIPDNWSSGVYIARLTSTVEVLPRGATTDVLFVVKATAPGKHSKILLQLTVNTYQAYNYWGGKSLYTDPPAFKVSFNRPDSNSWEFFYERDFIQWLENNKFEVEYCTGIDLHANPDLLNNYQLLLSVGHDEYWSWEMRDNVEAFIGNGGNVAFFSGNVCWWQVRFEDNNRTMVCYKDAQADQKANPGIDPHRLTVNWIDPLVSRRENRMTGASYEHGADWYDPDPVVSRPVVGYTVRLSQHWIFDNTNLKNNDKFGAESLIVGYEADAALFTETLGIPQVTGTDETPMNFQVLATADLSNWAVGKNRSGPNDDGTGKATLGIYRNNGLVFTAATVDWFRGLTGTWNVIQQITHNVMTRLSCPCTLSPDIANSGFEKWSGMASSQPDHWVLEGQGNISREETLRISGKYSLKIDATAGGTWISQGSFNCEGRNNYRVACWAKADHPGATIRLQSTASWRDFATASHSGTGNWEYLSAVGVVNDEGPIFPARVKIQLDQGVIAYFDNVAVEVF